MKWTACRAIALSSAFWTLMTLASGCDCSGECGDGRIVPEEECDDGNAVSADGCSATCDSEPNYRCTGQPSLCVLTCGDGVLDTDTGEECDDGVDNSDVVPDSCRTDCLLPWCGDDVVDAEAGEECEPPGAPECSADCLVEIPTDHGTCADPAPVMPGVSAFASLSQSETSEHEGTCRFVATPKEPFYGEAVFQLDLSVPADLVISTDNPGTDMDTYLYVRGGDCLLGTELACNDDIALGVMGPGNNFSEVSLTAAPAATYFIFVDGSFDSVTGLRAFGNVELSVAARFILPEGTSCDPAGDADRCAAGLTCVDDGSPECENLATPVCAAATPVADGVPMAGSTATSPPSVFVAACAAGTGLGPEEVWAHTVAAGSGVVDVLAGVTADATTPGYQPVVSVRAVCDDGATEIGCGLGPAGEATAVGWGVDATASDATVAIVVDGTADTGGLPLGDYTLTVTTRPVLGAGVACDPAGALDRCGTDLTCADPAMTGMPTCMAGGDCAAPLDLTPHMRAVSATVDMAGIRDGSCGGPGSFDERVFRITTPLVQDILLTTSSPGTGFDTVLYAREGDCAAGPELACHDDASASSGDLTSGIIIWEAAPGTDYFVFVDGIYKETTAFLTGLPSYGPFDLKARYRPIAAETEACDPGELLNRCDWGLECGALETCETTPAGAACAAATDVTSSVDSSGAMVSTLGETNKFVGSCGGYTGADVVVTFDLLVPVSSLVISTDNPGTTHTDTVLYVRSPRCESPVAEVACNDDIDVAALNFLSEVTIAPALVGSYAVIVDGWDAFAKGDVELSISTQ